MKIKGLIPVLLFLFIILVLVFPIAVSIAKVPESREEIVYGLSLWNGQNYASTFCPEEVNKIYMIADTPSVFSVRETEVYYWPITKEYKADWHKKNKLLEGTLEVLQGGKVIKKFETKKYAFRYPDKGFPRELNLLIGQEAENAYNNFEQSQDEYKNKLKQYYQRQQEYKEKTNNENLLLKKPVPPTGHITEPQQSFIVELSQGNYIIQFRNSSGNVIPATKKELTVFTRRRSGISYKVFPETKWTYPEFSDEMNDILYMRGKRTLYFQPYDAVEYPEKGYTKLSELHKPETDQLSQNKWRWAHLRLHKQGILQLLKNGKVIKEIEEKPYFVQQSSGYELGYKIIEWEQGNSKSSPSFSGYELDITIDGSYSVRMLDQNGKVLTASIREIRPINDENTSWLFIISLVPLFLGGIIFAYRKRY